MYFTCCCVVYKFYFLKGFYELKKFETNYVSTNLKDVWGRKQKSEYFKIECNNG